MRIFLNTAFGHEPYLMGARIAKHLDVVAIVPNLVQNQEQILEEEGLLNNVSLDDSLKRIYDDIRFEGDFNESLRQAAKHHYSASRGLAELKPDIEINIGSKIESGAPLKFYVYPYINSELLENALSETNLKDNIDRASAAKVHTLMKSMETGFRQVFLPFYHTFSYDYSRIPHDSEVQIPPMAEPVKKARHVPEDSALVMVSGTGSQKDYAFKKARELLGKEMNVYLPKSQEGAGEEFRYAVPSEIIGSPNLREIHGRPGFGILWQAQQSMKDFFAFPYDPIDDPEIYFNIRTLKTKPMQGYTTAYRIRCREMNGPKVVAGHIRHYINKRNSQGL